MTTRLLLIWNSEYIQVNIQMQEAFLRSQKLKYNEQTYNQWSQLPPNIPIPNASTIPMLLITFPKIIYLNQINADNQSIQLKLEWWGMKKPHSLLYNDMGTCQGKYLICTPMERLLSYFNDMKLLAIEVCNKYRAIGKAYLNFLVIKGWRGELYEGSMDFKQGNKKIGELAFTMQIKSVDNPFIMNPSMKETDKREKEFSIRINPYSGQEITKKSIVSQQKQPIYQNMPQFEQSYRRQEASKKVTMKSIIRQQLKDQQQLSYDRNIARQRSKKNIDYLLQQQPIARPNNIGKYEAELFRLVQDYNLIIGKHNNFPVSSTASQLQNNIEIQIVKIDAKLAAQLQIHIPLINGNANIYRLSQGGLVKLQFPSSTTEQQLMSYVRQCVVSFKQQKLEGSIKLSKILANCNQIIQIPLFQKEEKRGVKKQKASCWIKSIPPPKPKDQINNGVVAQIQTKSKQPQTKNQQLKVRQEQYLLLNVKAFNFIQGNHRILNAFLRFYCDEQLIGQTATHWNKRQDFVFNEKVSCKIWSKTIKFQLCDRQKSILKLASGFLDLTGPLGINLEIPLRTKHMGSQLIVGYISLDYFKNGFQSITKMAQFLNQKPKTVTNFINPTKNQEIQQEKQHAIDQLPIQQNQSIIHDITQQNKENDMSDNKLQQQIRQIKTDPKKMPYYQSKLSLLQIYNKIFTYCYNNQQIITNLLQKDEHKVTEFLQILNVLVSHSIISYSNLNELITHFLFKSTNSNNINKVNTVAFRECFQAFQTYYSEIVEEKDEKLSIFLHILEDKGLSINVLEFQLRSSKNIWEKLNQLFAYQKGKHINIIEDLKTYLQKKPKILERRELIINLSGAQLCDILRKYQVYQTTSGSQIDEQLLCQRIYRNTILLLQDIEPNIELYSYNELISFLQAELITLSVWQLLNLREYLSNYGIKRTLPKYPHLNNNNNQNWSGRFEQLQQNGKLDSKRNGAQSNRPGISKSPTFGYLHQPEHIKQELMTSQNYMVDSLALKMQNLAISPINYNSNQTKYQQFKAAFSNLKYTITDFYVNDQRMNFNAFGSQANYRSNSINQVPYSRQIGSSNEVIKQREQSNISEDYSQYPPAKKQQYRSSSIRDNQNFQIKLLNIEKAFSYKVQILFQQIEQVIQLQCLHNEWAAIVSEDGDYLGGVLIS